MLRTATKADEFRIEEYCKSKRVACFLPGVQLDSWYVLHLARRFTVNISSWKVILETGIVNNQILFCS